MLFSGLWRSLGADTDHLRIILQTKLLIDNRKPVSFGANKGMQRKKKKERRNSILMTMLLSMFMGIVYIFPIIITKFNIALGLFLFFSLFMFFFTFTILSDFSNILIDTKDKYILFPRPVNDKTITLSRLIYIGIYLFRLVIPMSIPAWAMFGFMHGWAAAVWFPFTVVLCVCIVLFLICGFYILLVRLAGAGKFNDVLNYFQIAFSIVFFGVWMFSSRMIDAEQIKDLNITDYPWIKFIPSYWIGVSYAWIDSGMNILPGTKWLSVLAIVFPVFSLWAVVKWLAPQFSKSLVSGESRIESPAKKKKVHRAGEKKLYARLADMFNNSDAAKAGFMITWLQTARNRAFQMRIYPSLAWVPVYFFFIIFNSKEPISELWQTLPEDRFSLVFLLYLTTFAVIQALNYITMSDQYRAAWVYYSTPVSNPGEIIAGAVKSMLVKFFLPYMVAIGAFVVYVWGVWAIVDVILATINIVLFVFMLARFNFRMLPFSMKEQVKDSGLKTTLRMLIVMGVITLFGLGQYILTFWWLKVIFAGLSAILLWLLYDSLVNLPWSRIKNTED